MPTLSNLTQTRLSIFLFDKSTNAPLRKIPIYAEISILVQLATYIVGDVEITNVPSNLITQILSLIQLYIPKYLGEQDFNSLNEAELHNFFNTIKNSILNKVGDNWNTFTNAPLFKQKSIVEESVKQSVNSITGQDAIEQPVNKVTYSYPLGVLATDHVGYASYYIENVVSKVEILQTQANNSRIKYSFFLYPLCNDPEFNDKNKADILANGVYTQDVILGKLFIVKPETIETLKPIKFVSMQQPGLVDWYISPSSFSVNPEFFIGANGCENLYPSNLATHQMRFFQLLRGKKIQDAVIQGPTNFEISPEIRAGWSLEYRTVWQPLGHTLGQIVYSLPLAPGEIRKIAVIDWKRKSDDSRDEDTSDVEQLNHNTHRDRNITETVNAALSEWQRGGSIMGGLANSFGISLGIGPLGLAGGAASSFGGGYSTSSGDRSINASTVQQVSDSFAQASSSMRELRSTIVLQSDQQETANAETRVIANHNHSHALTMLYYEVLRHFKVTTEYMRNRTTLMVNYSNRQINFDDENEIIKYRQIITNVLLDGNLAACFDVAQNYLCYKAEIERTQIKTTGLEQFNTLDSFRLIINFQKPATEYVLVYILTNNIEMVGCSVIDPAVAGATTPNYLLQTGNSGGSYTFTLKPDRKILWSDAKGIIIQLKGQYSGTTTYNPPPTDWILDSVDALTSLGGLNWSMIAKHDPTTVPVDSQVVLDIIPFPASLQNPLDKLDDAGRCCLNKLKKHLKDNSFYYNEAIWMLEDPNERAARFANITINGEALIGLINNRPIEVYGNYVAFHCAKQFDELIIPTTAKVEELMTLPTRGVFGEAKLGHCNATEIIDNTRFWDWQTSPITETPPDISAVSTDSRNVTQNLTPSQFPNSIVNIVNPSNIPDPTGMSSALNLLGQSNIFRDMSTSSQVEDLLKKLSDNSISIAQAANAARGIMAAQQNSASGSGSSNTNGSSGSGNNNKTNSGSSNLTPQSLMDWSNAAKNSGMSSQDQKEMLHSVSEGAKKTVNPQTSSTPQASKSKDKKFVFQALDYKGNSIAFSMDVIVYNILANKKVFEGTLNNGFGIQDIVFDSASPTIKIFLSTVPTTITFGDYTYKVPEINKQSADLITIPDTQQMVSVTLKQNPNVVTIQEKSKEDAAKTLTNEYGAKLGFNETVAAEILAKDSTQSVTTTGSETTINFSVSLPGDMYDLIVK